MKANVGGIEIEGSVSEVYEFIERGVREHDKLAKPVQATPAPEPVRRYHKKRVLKRWTPTERFTLANVMHNRDRYTNRKDKRAILKGLCKELGRSKGSILHEYSRMVKRGDA